MTSIRFAAGLLLGATLISTSTLATAQDFPKGPIKLIVPVPPGGGVDLLSRTLAPKMSANLGVPVNAKASQSSLQLALENEKLKDAQAAYLTALQRAGEKESDVIGYVFAINGKLNSAEVYPSNGLFRKMWPKLLQASITEAIGHKNGDSDPTPSSDVVMAFLDEAEKGKSSEKSLTANVRLETRDAEQSLYFETRRPSGAWVHRSYLKK